MCPDGFPLHKRQNPNYCLLCDSQSNLLVWLLEDSGQDTDACPVQLKGHRPLCIAANTGCAAADGVVPGWAM